MLVEIAIGDAYGMGFEYADDNIPLNDLTQYRKHPLFTLKPGQYTDDTQMSLAIAETLLSSDEWTKENITRHFVQCFKRDPRDGYARQFQTFLEGIKDEKEFLEKIKPESDKSGGAMRAGPIGYMKDPETVKAMSSLQASITHDTPDGRAAAEATSLMCHYFIYGLGPKAELGQWLEKWVPSHKWNDPWTGRIKQQGWMDVRAAVTVIQQEHTLSAILKRIVDFTGDTDTAGAISMAAASQCKEIVKDLPSALYLG